MSGPLQFDSPDLPAWLANATAAELDELDFGVIGFDEGCLVDRYNSFESRAAGLSLERVLGLHLFDLVAPCMNNAMVAQRFHRARQEAVPLDATIDYVLTLRMRPTKVKLRLVAQADASRRFVLVQRRLN